MNDVQFYCIIDFEGTCEEDNPKDYIHEIIEFPAVLLDATTLEKVSALVLAKLHCTTVTFSITWQECKIC